MNLRDPFAAFERRQCLLDARLLLGSEPRRAIDWRHRVPPGWELTQSGGQASTVPGAFQVITRMRG